MVEVVLHAASRESLSEAERALDQVLGDPGANAAVVGEELYSFARVLDAESSLRRAVADASSDPGARTELVRRLVEGKMSQPSMRVLDTAVAGRWSKPRQLVEGLSLLGASALLSSAEAEGMLETVEQELFRLARTLAEHAELDSALADQTTSAEAKRKLVREVFGGKLATVTQTLLEQVVAQPGGRGITNVVDKLAERAAERRQRSVAHVITASELTEAQRDALAQRLHRVYGRSIAVHVEVRPGLIGGLVVKIGDEVIDGSALGRLRTVRGQLAR